MPMRKPPLFSILLWAVAAALLVGVGAWTLVISPEVPSRAALPDRDAVVRLPAATDGEPDGPAQLEGAWRLQRRPGVFVGYRVTEQWAAERFDKAAVGRTEGVSGSMKINGGRLVSARIEVDMTMLSSGQSARDALLRTQALETERFPSAQFVLGDPVPLPEVRRGEATTLMLRGDLTLHGRTREVDLDLQARWNGRSIDVAGGAVVFLPDFGIDPPSTPFISVEDTGEIEFQLVFMASAGS
jgi:polyisoprenoid-binding protein YceI